MRYLTKVWTLIQFNCFFFSFFFCYSMSPQATQIVVLSSSYRCKILDKHLAILAKKHVETKFIKLNVEKAPFLTERLRIKVIPTLALLLDGKTKDYVVGFSDLGNTDEFPTEMLEWRLGCADVINYRWDIMNIQLQNHSTCNHSTQCQFSLILT